jgi:hypothetical protein
VDEGQAGQQEQLNHLTVVRLALEVLRDEPLPPDEQRWLIDLALRRLEAATAAVAADRRPSSDSDGA